MWLAVLILCQEGLLMPQKHITNYHLSHRKIGHWLHPQQRRQVTYFLFLHHKHGSGSSNKAGNGLNAHIRCLEAGLHLP